MVTELMPETNRPYGPPSNVTAVLQRLRSRNLPERVDADYLRDAGVSEGTVGRTLFGLRFLGLTTEDDEPTQALRSIHTSTDEEYRSILSGLVREAYSDVLNVIDPAEATQDRIINVFRRYTPASQRNRMVVFFLGMCREAGIATMDVPRQRQMREPRPASPRAATPVSRTQSRPRVQQTHGGAGGGSGGGGGAVHPALDGLVKSLPTPGELLSEERLTQWLSMARATLRFIYPEQIVPNQEEEELE